MAKELHKGISEDMELHVLVDKLVYRPQWFGPDDMDGEALIYSGRNDQWPDRIPRPPDAVSGTSLAAAMHELGHPSRPKPDISYGYRDDAFPDDLRTRIGALPADLLLYPKPPWFPYMVVQWKVASGTVREAEQQVRRDTSAAIDTTYRLFEYAEPDQEPSPANTCVFSLLVHARTCEYRLHWRRVGTDGTISYEGDTIARAFLDDLDGIFKTRGVILKTLDWARGSRLTAIQQALRALGSGAAVMQGARYTSPLDHDFFFTDLLPQPSGNDQSTRQCPSGPGAANLFASPYTLHTPPFHSPTNWLGRQQVSTGEASATGLR